MKVGNKDTSQGSVRGLLLFNIFLNDLEIDLLDEPLLVVYADDSNIISPVYDTSDRSKALGGQFMVWSSNNGMSCNPSKCKGNIFKKKGCTKDFPLVPCITQTRTLSILGVTFQEDCRFTADVRNKLMKASKYLFILRSLRKEGYTQAEN